MKKEIPPSLSSRPFFNLTGKLLKFIKMELYKLNKKAALLFALVILLILSGCANNEVVEPCLSGHKYGFFGGLWHGFIAPFDFIGMLFNNKITMYAQNNNGGFYALGFLIGSGGWGFFGSRGMHKVQHRRVTVSNTKIDDAEIVV
jgi:hypothetical protein